MNMGLKNILYTKIPKKLLISFKKNILSYLIIVPEDNESLTNDSIKLRMF